MAPDIAGPAEGNLYWSGQTFGSGKIYCSSQIIGSAVPALSALHRNHISNVDLLTGLSIK